MTDEATKTSIRTLLVLMNLESLSLSFAGPNDQRVVLSDGETVVTVNASATLYTRADRTVTIRFEETNAGSARCILTSTIDVTTIDGLAPLGLFASRTFTGLDLATTVFGAPQLTVRSSERTFVLESVPLNDPTVVLTEPRISLNSLRFRVERSLAAAADTSAGEAPDTLLAVVGNLTISRDISGDSVSLEVRIDIPVNAFGGLDRVRLLLTSGDPQSGGISFRSILGILGVDSQLSSLPPAVQGFTQLQLQSFEVVTRSLTSVDSLRLTIGTTSTWTIASNVSLSGISFTVDVRSPFNSPSLMVTATGTITVDGASLTTLVGVPIPFNQGNWVVSCNTPDNINLYKLSKLPGDFDISSLWVPFGTQTALLINLNYLTLTFNPVNGTFSLIDFRVIFPDQWQIIPGVFTVSNPEIGLTIENPMSSSRNISADILGLASFFDLADVEFRAQRAGGRWMLSANTINPINLGALFAKFFQGDPPDWLNAIKTYSITSIRFEYTTSGGSQPGVFFLGASIQNTWNYDLGGQPGAVQLTSISASVGSQPDPAQPAQRIWTFAVSGTVRLYDTLNVTGSFQYRTGNGQGSGAEIAVEFDGVRGVYNSANKRIDVSLGNRTIGDLVNTLNRLVNGQGASDYQFESPWDLVAGISLQGLVFSFYFDGNSQKRCGITYRFPTPVDLGFMKIVSVSVIVTINKKIRFEAEVIPFTATTPSPFGWNLDDANVPKPPGRSARIIDLKYLGIGQRLELMGANATRSVDDGIAAMKTAFANPSTTSHPLTGMQAGLRYNPQMNWLVGADFQLFGALAIGLIFNDSNIAGVRVGVDRDSFRYLGGLKFEILYKKVTESIGVYQMEIRVPDAIRQIELGQVSITLPIIAFELYTNGNFKVDFGFPKDNDFSRSFMLQVFPFLGAGGFYFALLEGATSPRLPANYNPNTGVFRPVLSFGIGLSLGIGKSINRGIFSAQLSITFEGILEGVIGFFNPTSGNGTEIYYWLQGTLGVVGRIQGSVSFAVISASVSLVVYARIGATFESYQPLVLFFEAGVDVNLTVRIGVGWLSTDISCSFSTSIRESFTIPVRGNGTAPWVGGGQHALPNGAAPHGMIETKGAAPKEMGALSWDTIDMAGTGERVLLEFRPMYTVAEGPNGQKSNYVAMLFLRSASESERETDHGRVNQITATDFEALATGMLVWAINASVNADNETAVDVSNIDVELLDKDVRIDHLQEVFDSLARHAGAAPSFETQELLDFLHLYFELVIVPLQQNRNSVNGGSSQDRPTLAVFPMPPDLELKAFYDDTMVADIDFGTYNMVPDSYSGEIANHFNAIAMQFQTALEASSDAAEMQAAPEYTGDEESMASYVFDDYFLLLARGVVQAAMNLLKEYSVDANGQTLADLEDTYGVDPGEVGVANADASIIAPARLQVGGIWVTTAAGDTFAALAADNGFTTGNDFLESIGRLNALTPGLVATDTAITIGDDSIDVVENETLYSMATRLHASPGAVAITIASRQVLNAGRRLFLPTVPATVLTVGSETNLRAIASRYVTTPDMQFETDLALMNAFVPGIFVPGTIFTMATGDAYLSTATDSLWTIAAAVGFTVESVAAASNELSGIIAPGVRLSIPPASVGLPDPPTLRQVQTTYGVAIADVAFINADVLVLEDEDGRIEVPNAQKINIRTLKKEMLDRDQLIDLGGVVSRFMVPGLRLPIPTQQQAPEPGLWPNCEPDGLYRLTGQQFELDNPLGGAAGGPHLDVMLVGGANAGWYSMEGDMEDYVNPENDLEVYVNPVRVRLEPADLDKLDQMANEQLLVDASPYRKIPMSQTQPKRFPLGRPVQIQMSGAFAYTIGTPPSGVLPTILNFSEGMRRVLALPLNPEQRFDLALERPDGSVGTLNVYSWATAITVKVRRVRLPDGSPAAMTYELDGADAEGTLTLEKIVSRGGASGFGFIQDIHVLFAGQGVGALQTDGPNAISAFILQTNLSTLTNPQGSKSLEFAKGVPATVANDFKDNRAEILRVLWEGSIVRSGGYYLYYRCGAASRGLPDSAFKDDGTADITLLITYGYGAGNYATSGLPPFVNRVVVGADVTQASAFAVSHQQSISVAVNGTTTLNQLMASYHTNLADLAADLGGQGLSVTSIAVPGTVYQVAHGGETLGAVANRFHLGIDAIKSANTDLDAGLTADSELPEYQTLVIPPFTHPVTAGQNLAGIAGIYNVPLTDLVAPLAGSAIFAPGPNVNIRSRLITKAPTVPPGHTGFQLFRVPQPTARVDDEPTIAQQLESLYSLLAYWLVQNQWCDGSMEGLPRGPGTELAQFTDLPDVEGRWKYEQVIPAYRFVHSALPAANPYRGVGALVEIGVDWRDVFGNLLNYVFEVDGCWGSNILPARLGYTDEVIGIGRWPSVRSSYGIGFDGNSNPTNEILLEFDVARYLVAPDGEQASLGDVYNIASADYEAYRRIADQLACADVTAWGSTTLGGGPQTLSIAALRVWVGSIVSFLDQLFDVLIDPNAPQPDIPDDLTLPIPASFANNEAIFPLIVRFGIKRTGRIDDAFLDMPAVREATEDIEPAGPIRDFATNFECIYGGTKLAAGLSRLEDVETDSRNRLWVVKLGQLIGDNRDQGPSNPNKRFQYAINAQQQVFFAPIPLATSPIGSEDLNVYNYVSGQGLADAVTKKTYKGVDLDAWGRAFLNAVDTVLLPQYATPAHLLDLGSAAPAGTRALETIIAAKRTIAAAITGMVQEIGDTGLGNLGEAGELFSQRLLVRLSAAYETDAIVQLGVNVDSPYADADTTYVPKLYGQTVGRRPGTEDSKPEFTLSTARVPLARESQHLTFLFSAETALPERLFEIDVDFNVSALEYQIADVPGIADYRASSWLTFIIPPDSPSVTVSVPVPIRKFPPTPTLIQQELITTVDATDDEEEYNALTLAETREWQYGYTYERVQGTHDVIFTSPRFNVANSELPHGIGSEDPDLFQALAMFDHAWDAIQQDLFEPLVKIRQGVAGADDGKADAALTAFAAIAAKVAGAWGRWMCDRDFYRPSYGAEDPYLYVVSEDDRDILVEAQVVRRFTIAVRVCSGQADVPLPRIDVEGWETHPVDNVLPGWRMFWYSAEGENGTEILDKDTAAEDRQRTVVFETLDILNKQNAWGGVYTTRNENIFDDAACNPVAQIHTNPEFIYRTPMVRFGSLLTPLIEYDGTINVGSLNPAEPSPKGIRSHIGTLFTKFFEGIQNPAPNETRSIRVDCRYEYRLGNPYGIVNPMIVTLPIVMSPPFDFRIHADEDTACPQQATTFACALADAITTWYYARLPERDQGRFIFDIAVYSSLGNTGKLPIYHVKSLRLNLSDVNDLTEDDCNDDGDDGMG
ncbi:MAG TPA: LysM peptidoglycan-binding domain-containing protein [Candidatus Kapabacteria bacterium]|nr:LysM peptidoglycan-binding domain-containing protein [Candidatus Kapabacteria bacterium]